MSLLPIGAQLARVRLRIVSLVHASIGDTWKQKTMPEFSWSTFSWLETFTLVVDSLAAISVGVNNNDT